MYIKCTTPEQLDEVRKYIKPSPINSIRDLFASKWMFDNNESVYIDEEDGDWNSYSFIKERNLEYIPYSQWQLQTLRDLGFDTDLANDMLFRCDKFKRNDMNKKDQFIQLEGGKLNITKTKELGLWVEDKKVFTINETNEIQYNEYKIKSTVNTFWKRVVRIFKNDELIVELINPTPDKLRSEFSYYGIKVSVE